MRCPICNDCISQWELHKCEEVMVDNQELTSEQLLTENEQLKSGVFGFHGMVKDLQRQLTATQQALDEAQANIAAQEISYKEWVVKHSEMYAENKKLQQALDSAVEALEEMIWLCENAGDFSNGNTCPTGSIDEGNVMAARSIDRAKAALASIKE